MLTVPVATDGAAPTDKIGSGSRSLGEVHGASAVAKDIGLFQS